METIPEQRRNRGIKGKLDADGDGLSRGGPTARLRSA